MVLSCDRRLIQKPASSTKHLRRFIPSVDSLEARELQAVVAGRSAVVAHPGLLPSTGQYVTIHVYGALASTRNTPPDAFFVVTDEYRRDEPHGTVKLTPIPPAHGLYMYAFDFNIRLQAQRSTGTDDGRHYNILVGGKDPDNADGRTISVYVPKVFPRSAYRGLKNVQESSIVSAHKST